MIKARIYGGTYIALAGPDSVLLACDSRFSSQQTGPFLLGEHKRSVFLVGHSILVGCFGLDADARTIHEHVASKLLKLDSATELQPQSVSRLISSKLYESNLICSPIIASYTRKWGPYIAGLDGLGAITHSSGFVVAGTAAKSMFAILESQYKAGMDPQQLAALAERAFKMAMQRDVLSGCTVRILTITHDGIFEKLVHTDDV